MYRRIVCALDIGKLQKCERLLKRAAALVDDGGEIDVVHVVEEVPSYLADLPQEVVTDAIRDSQEKFENLCRRMAIIDRGEILLEAEPLAATHALRGRVWKRVVAKHELPDVEQRYRLLCTKLQSGRTIVHVQADERPAPEFEPVEPDLEDVYFNAMARHT